MSDFARRIEDELKEAFEVKDERALHRATLMLSERIVDRPTYVRDSAGLHRDVRVIAETMKRGFEMMEKRFESIQHNLDKRFEQADKRFESMQHNVDKRFSSLQWFIGLGFTLLVVLMSIYEFIR